MDLLIQIIVCFIAGMGAGLGTGFAGMSAAAVISPMLITFLDMPAYEAVGIALASDVLASAVSAYTYGKNKNLDIKNGFVMMVTVLVFTLVGSFAASKVPNATMGSFSTVMTLLVGIKFIVRPVMTTKEKMTSVSPQKRVVQSILSGMMVGFICGFIGAGGGMMMLLLLTSVLGYELKTAVGTSVFIMTFTALTGAGSHFMIGGMPQMLPLVLCIASTLLWARIAARFANKASAVTLNRATGVVLTILGAAIFIVNIFFDSSASNNSEVETIVSSQEELQAAGDAFEDEETEVETAGSYGIFNYDYTGYQDECTGWQVGYESFVRQDYDNDGRIDRVYKEYVEETDVNFYRIEFGNGDVIAMERGVAGTIFLNIKSADINEDGIDEIILSFLAGASTDMRGAGGMEVYEKRGDSYERAVLPFNELDGDCSQSIPVRYQTVRDRLIRVSVEDGRYETLVPISVKQWDSLSYDMYYSDTVENTAVWDNYILEKDGKEQLVCKVHLFDKWSDFGLFAVLAYQDGEYVIDRWMRTTDESSEEIEEDSCWHVEDYLLCSCVMETGGQPVGVGLWLESGTYGSMEEFVPSGGVYEENFMGQYYLLVTDEEGDVLSKRYIAQDFGDPWQMNFPGAFEIVVGDYNQDSCPDFSIGTFGSSSTNIYALYTIWENGEIGLLGSDIPNVSPADFSVAFETDGDKTFYAGIWDNTIGQEERIIYEWNEEEKLFLQKE